ncbi:hypothetical protein BDP27DRAFT_1428121 [Rhodocollybia butyracea]|uniref:Uncharacterized protein n=1 Tax=Rhodocollybia butyracea TaxID=206335 RepID=A0A9P5PF61_9AGAR|nr:hypothetical protein BDP27DRAFT_1428121 [Rhodocollybia butyracea]
MRLSIFMIAFFATFVAASTIQERQNCFPDTCDCNEDGCTPSSPVCCANGSCPC